MKTVTPLLACVSMAGSAYAQGAMNFTNLKPFKQPIFDANGELLTGAWAQLYAGKTADSMLPYGEIAPGGTVYVGSRDHKIHAFYGSAGPTDSAWPMFGQNAQRTSRTPLLPVEMDITGTTVFPFTFTFPSAKGRDVRGAGEQRLGGLKIADNDRGHLREAQFTDTCKARFPRQYYRVKRTE